MDTARQVLRFSIPGSVTLMLILGFIVTGRLLQGDSWEGVGSAIAGNVSAVAVIVAAIPLGFVIYQVYYATYRAVVWPWRPRPLKSGTRWVRIDRGAQVLSRLPSEQLERVEALFGVELDLEPILRREETWLGRRAHAYRLRDEFVAQGKGDDAYERYRLRWQENWNIVRALVEVSDGGDSLGALKSEYTTLSDIYHALGACRAGVQLAGVVSIATCLLYALNGDIATSIAMAAITLVTTLALFWVFHRTRGHTWVSAQESLKLGLTALFKRRPELLGPK